MGIACEVKGHLFLDYLDWWVLWFMWCAVHSPNRAILSLHCLNKGKDLFRTHALFHYLANSKSHLFHILRALIALLHCDSRDWSQFTWSSRSQGSSAGMWAGPGQYHSRSFGLTLGKSASSFGSKCMRHPSALSVKGMWSDNSGTMPLSD